jgi:peptidoglycan/LPS O-acetylase OafA/YrhL
MTSVVTERTTGGRLRHLDGYRGLAALAVVVFHVAAHSRWVARPDRLLADGGAWVGRLGNFGVCVFFLLSGLLIYRPFAVAHLDATTSPRWSTFVWRRALRIFPAYWVALSVVYLLGYESERVSHWHTYVTEFLLVQNYVDRGLFQGLFVAWTLCVEFGFYLLVPLVAAGARRLPGGRSTHVADRCAAQAGAIALVFASGWAFRLLVLYADPDLPGSETSWLPNYLDWFALGMLLGLAHAWREQGGPLPRPLVWLADHPAVALLFAVQLYWVGVQLNISGDLNSVASPGQTIGRFLVNGAAAFLVLLPAVLGRRRAALEVLDRRPLVFLGTVSYGVYLWHTIVLGLAEDAELEATFVPLLALTIASSVAIASFSHRVVELPAMSLRPGRRVRRAREAPHLAAS